MATATKFHSFVDSTAGAGPWVSTSLTPNANKLYVVFVTGWYNNVTNPGTWSISGWGLTWTTYDTVLDTNSTDMRTSVFYAQSGGSPSAGALTVSNTTNMDDAIVCVVEIASYDTSTPAVQSNRNISNSGATISVTLSALSNSNNLVLIGGGDYNGNAASTGSGYTLVSSDVDATDGLSQGVSVKNPGDASPVLTFAGAANHIAIAVEIADAGGGGAAVVNELAKMGVGL